MSTVLYRKYRSQNFDELVGQDHITKILKNAVKSNQLAHAFLLVGSRGTGKTSTARILAKAVNCKSPSKDGNPCNECEICKSISDGTFLDLIEIDAASNRGIDQIRELKERIEFSPSEGRFKVYIIDEVHMLTTEAFNALLKTLEEPPAHVIFILATTDVHKLPATILSRCQRYDFRLGSDEEIRKTLEDIVKKEGLEIEKEAMNILVRNAQGSYRDALSLLDVVINGQPKDSDIHNITESETRQVLGIPEFNMVDSFLRYLVDGESVEALGCIDELESKGTNLPQFVSYTLEILREVLVAKITSQDLSNYSFTKNLDQKGLMSLISAFIRVERDLKNTTNQSLLMQMLIPEFCTLEESVHVQSKPAVQENVVKVKEVVKPKEVVKKEDDTTTIVEKESEKVEVVNSDRGVLNEKDIQSNWKDIVARVKPVNNTLSAFLSVSRVSGVEGDVVNIEVPFKFYKDQIEDYSSKQLICSSINDVVGVACRLVCTVNDTVKPKIQSSADVVLKNVPVVEKRREEEKKDEKIKPEFKKKKISADVDAIFAGM